MAPLPSHLHADPHPHTAKALWELTNSPFGKARPPPIAASAATAAAAAAAAGAAAGPNCLTPHGSGTLGDMLGLGFHSPPPALQSPSVNYNKCVCVPSCFCPWLRDPPPPRRLPPCAIA